MRCDHQQLRGGACRRLNYLYVFSAAGLFSSPSHAAVHELTFTGHIEYVQSTLPAPFGSVVQDTPFSVRLLLDDAAQDQCPGISCGTSLPRDLPPSVANHFGFYPIMKYEVTVGDVTVSGIPRGVLIMDDPPIRPSFDMFGARADLPNGLLAEILFDTADALFPPYPPLDSDRLPTSLDPKEWDNHYFGMYGPAWATGTIDAVQSRIVPEPATVVLLFLPTCLMAVRGQGLHRAKGC